MIVPEEAAQLVRASCAMINAWTTGRAIGLPSEAGYRMPRWQFDPMLWDVTAKRSDALDTTNGWVLLGFLETPQGALGGRAPRQALEQGEADRVVAIAEQEGNQARFRCLSRGLRQQAAALVGSGLGCTKLWQKRRIRPRNAEEGVRESSSARLEVPLRATAGMASGPVDAPREPTVWTLALGRQ